MHFEPANIEIRVIYVESNATKDCPSLPGLKFVYQEDGGVSQTPEKLCFVAPKRPCHPHNQV